jgi:hypothetical protein
MVRNESIGASLICRRSCQEAIMGQPQDFFEGLPLPFVPRPEALMACLTRRTFASLISACWLTQFRCFGWGVCLSRDAHGQRLLDRA